MARRKYTREFKESAVRLVRQQGYSAAEAARSRPLAPVSGSASPAAAPAAEPTSA